MKKIGFFEESEGVKSSTRLQSFLLLIFYFILTLFWLYSKNPISGDFIFYSFMILLAIFTPKYLHKLAELKSGLKDDSITKPN